MTQYRQIAHRLRFQMGPGAPDIESERPRQRKTGAYQDLDEQGRSTTLVDIPAGARVDIGALLAAGAIEALPESAPEPARKGGKGGEGRG